MVFLDYKMNVQQEFTWKIAWQMADNLVFQSTGRHLSDLEVIILRGAWHNQTYEKIAEAENYASNYLSKDIGCRLWGNLSAALQEKVSKKNFKSALQREWHNRTYANQTQSFVTQNLVFPEGSVALNSPFYLTRSPIEDICYETIAKPNSLIRIKGAKWMGKTSLVNRILQQAHFQNQATVYLDFGNVEQSVIKNLDKLLRWLCEMVSRQLKLTSKVNRYWSGNNLGSSDRCTVYFTEYILTKVDSEIVLALDNVDRLFAYQEVAEDLLRMLRGWHESGKVKDFWSKLKLVLAHSTEVYIPLDLNQSPLNSGVPILLEEFNGDRVQTLAVLYQFYFKEFEVKQLMDWVGGHPYLIQLAMYQMKTQDLSLKQFLSQVFNKTSIYHNLLDTLMGILYRFPELSLAFHKVIHSPAPVSLNPLQIYRLHSLGLIKHQGDLISPRCQLYQDYFINKQLIVDS